MKLILTLFIGFIFAFIALACDNKHESGNDIYHTWEADSFVSLESEAYSKNENNRILLTFKKSGTYKLSLDKNRCGGSLISIADEQIELGVPMCTKVCCDSKFSNKLAQMLPQVRTYAIEDFKLKLFIPDWGYIEFRLAS